jgi:small subunit ribosomal protein S9
MVGQRAVLENYFPRMLHRKRVEEAFKVAETEGQFDVVARVRGGGITGQADAIRSPLPVPSSSVTRRSARACAAVAS